MTDDDGGETFLGVPENYQLGAIIIFGAVLFLVGPSAWEGPGTSLATGTGIVVFLYGAGHYAWNKLARDR